MSCASGRNDPARGAGYRAALNRRAAASVRVRVNRDLLVVLPLILCGVVRAQDAWDLAPIVRGFVVHESGAAVDGATVGLYVVGEDRVVVRWKVGGGFESQLDYQPLLGVAATATTGFDGRFELRPPAWTRAGRHRFRITASRPDLGVVGVAWDPIHVPTVMDATLTIPQCRRRECVLVDHDGVPQPGIELVRQGEIFGQTVRPCFLDRVRTDAVGRFFTYDREIRDGELSIDLPVIDGLLCTVDGETCVLTVRDRSRADGVDTWRIPRTTSPRLEYGSSFPSVDVRGSTLRAVDAQGRAVPVFAVARTPTPWKPGGGWRSYANGTSGAARSLRIDGEGPLHVFAPGFAPALFVDERPDARGAVIVRLNAGAVVRGRVVDRHGFGVSGAMVELADAAEPLDAFVSARVGRVRSRGPWAETDDFGGFELRCVPAGRWRIRAGARGFAPAESPVLRTLGEEIYVVPSIALPDAASIVVRGGAYGIVIEDPQAQRTAHVPGDETMRLDFAPGTTVRLRRRNFGCVQPPTLTATAPADGAVVVTLP